MPEGLAYSRVPRRDPAPPQFSPAADAALRIGIAIALLIPCFWLPRIQAGDFSSHLYNAWLAARIQAGAVPGLAVVPVWTNVLGDWMLASLLGGAGPNGAAKIVAAIAILTFFWGAFFLMDVATGRRPWLFCPILAMLSYGTVFHFGFLNFYLSTGLCLWVLALLWKPSRPRRLVAMPLLALAVLAHPMPVVWVLSVVAYLYLARRMPVQWRPAALVIGMAALLLCQITLMSLFPSRWTLDQTLSLDGLAGFSGAGQIWLYDTKYLILAGALMLIGIVLLLERVDQGKLAADLSAHLWFLHLTAFVLMPSAIQFPHYQHVLAYIPQRISLLTGISFCIMAGAARHGRGITRLSTLVALLFFACLYIDHRAFNLAEDLVSSLVANLPPGQRVVASLTDSGARLNALAHVVDRACIGHCFSYADYEPATGQFRIRVTGPNRAVAPNMAIVQEIEEGAHTVRPEEEPLYAICSCPAGGNPLCLRVLKSGERTCGVSLPVSRRLAE